MKYLLLLFIFIAGCNTSIECDWTWIKEESCMMDYCDIQGADSSECREDKCYCCTDEYCWYSGVEFQ